MSAIASVYAKVPALVCKGLCQQSCGPIACSAVEADELQNNGINLPRFGADLTCSHLHEGKCAIYESRPLICRLWGNVRKMACPHGCKPKGGYLTDDQAGELLNALDDGREPYTAEIAP